MPERLRAPLAARAPWRVPAAFGLLLAWIPLFMWLDENVAHGVYMREPSAFSASINVATGGSPVYALHRAAEAAETSGDRATAETMRSLAAVWCAVDHADTWPRVDEGVLNALELGTRAARLIRAGDLEAGEEAFNDFWRDALRLRDLDPDSDPSGYDHVSRLFWPTSKLLQILKDSGR